MSTFFFLLGRTPKLSLRELEAVTQNTHLHLLTPQVAEIALRSDEEAREIFSKLGGSLKVMKHEGEFEDFDEQKLREHIAAYLAQSDRPTFAIAELGRENIETIDPTEIKDMLKARGIGSRFIEGPRDGLSASVLLHHPKVIELNIIQIGAKVIFAQTLAVQDIDDWTRRDRAKPYADRKKGLLPPKLARIMVNLSKNGNNAEKQHLYDPFCGSGTVLMEGLLSNYEVIGSDLDKNSVDGAQINLKWFEETYQTGKNSWKVFIADATTVQPAQMGRLIDVIVTEPFLGKPTPNPTQLPNIFKGLEKMYLGAFKNWTKILAQDARVVIIFPYVQAGKTTFSLEKMIDKLQSLGYTASSEPVLYARPQAVVQRQIWIFTFRK